MRVEKTGLIYLFNKKHSLPPAYYAALLYFLLLLYILLPLTTTIFRVKEVEKGLKVKGGGQGRRKGLPAKKRRGRR